MVQFIIGVIVGIIIMCIANHFGWTFDIRQNCYGRDCD